MLCLAAAGCGELPQPFSHDRTADNPLAAPKARAGIKVAAVAGMAHGDAFAEEVAAAFRSEDIAAHAGPGPNAGYTLMGRALAKPEPTGTQVKIGMLWRVVDPRGRPAGLYHQDHVAERTAWDAGAPPLLRRLARAAVSEIAPDLADPKRGPRPESRPVTVLDISGAPGDGRISLRRALAFELRKLGFTVSETDSPAGGTLVLAGTVKVGPAPGGGGDRVEIAWEVRDPGGRVLGTVKQDNVVKAGSLQRSWGVTAVYAARAAAPGIVRILRRRSVAAGP